MTEHEKNRLAQLNGYTNERYTDMVKEGVRQEYPSPDEFANLRKGMAYLFELVSKLLACDANIPEFAEYNEKVEKIKAEAKATLGI